LNELVDRTLEFVKPQNKYDDVTFDVRRDGRPLPIYADPQQIQQVLLNLLSNAADAMHSRPGSTRTLRLQAGEDGSEIVLEVADDGIGIDTATLGRIFEPRFTTKATGNGFGLSVCHRIVSNHRGRVAVKSTPGVGTVFSVRLPVHAAAPQPAPAFASSLGLERAQPGAETPCAEARTPVSSPAGSLGTRETGGHRGESDS
jgi:signal transduction histidine kinase